MGPGQGQRHGMGSGSIGSNIIYRNVHAGLKQEQGPGPIVSYFASPITCTGHGPCPVQCESYHKNDSTKTFLEQ